MRALSKWFIVSAVVLGGLPSAAAAAPSAATDDVRCLLTMAALGNVDKTRTEQARVGIYFFSGRLSARAGFDVAEAIKAEGAKMKGPDFQAALPACGATLQNETKIVQTGLDALRPSAPPTAAGAPPAPKK
jgi:hypothetical protein